MAISFFFYDLETSGFNPHETRIMQFAGQRTDMDLKPIGEPVNELIAMTPDILPDPDAVLITGITPQTTIVDGRTEADFLQLFTDEIATPGTIFVGFNSVRFDDEFVRCLHYRNFYDPYEWQWRDDRGRWDLLDVVRMTRALRPDGIQWPFDVHGKPTNRLELLTGLNKLDHEHAHDALSDVQATIEVARLIQTKQPKLFDYLFSMREKKKIAALVESRAPFVYTSGKYPSEFDKTTVAAMVAPHPRKQGALVYDLRHDPADWAAKTPEQLVEAWRWQKDSDDPRLPVKTLQFNRCPAVAPLSVLDETSQERLKLDLKLIEKHRKTLGSYQDFPTNLLKAVEIMDKKQQTSFLVDEREVDGRMYDGFAPDGDRQVMRVVRAAVPEELTGFVTNFHDERLKSLLPLYKARNFPKTLTDEERAAWEEFRTKRLTNGGQKSRLARYFARLQEIASRDNLTTHQQYLLEELQLYAESIMPETDAV